MTRTGSIASWVPPAVTTILRPARSPSLPSRTANVAEQVRGLQQPSPAHETGGQTTLRRACDVNAALQQGFDVRLRCRAVVHVGVHGRSDHDRSAGREHSRGDRLVGHTERDSSYGVGGRGRDDYYVGSLGQGPRD